MSGDLYQYFYLIICFVLLLIVTGRYKVTLLNFDKRRFNNVELSVLLILIVLFIGFRPVHVAFSDMVGYASYYDSIIGLPYFFDKDVDNIIFDNLLTLLAHYRFPSVVFFTLISIIYFGGICLASQKMFPNDAMLAFIVYLTAFSTFSYATNGIKAGAAASIFLVALAYKDKLWLSIPLAFLSWGFHHSMNIVVIVYAVALVFRNTKVFFSVWTICLLLAIFQVGYFQTWFAQFANDKESKYLLTDEDSFLTGFRLDFILYSAAPIIIGFWMIIKKGINNKDYELWLRVYLLMNSIWMLCMNASFTNRIAYLSWFMYPFVLILPFFYFKWNKYQYLYGKRVAICHAVFTLFMDFIYYQGR